MKVRLILGDQLNEKHSWFHTNDDETVYVLFEMRQETDYTKHHIQKVIAFFSAMRNFNTLLKSKGHRTHYLTLDADENKQNLSANLSMMLDQYAATHFEYQLPDEYRLDKQLKDFCSSLTIGSNSCDTEHFMSERMDLTAFFQGKKKYVMEFYYQTSYETWRMMQLK